jgi:HPt (histidine-containing phosphotransfer) domain-containing protein
VVKVDGLNEDTRVALFRAAHDIKGEAATFGYPWSAQAAASLCRLLDNTPHTSSVPLALIDQHVDAIRAIVRENARPDVAERASVLTAHLRQAADEFIER